MPNVIPIAEWVRAVFDHPVTERAWHWDCDVDTTELPAGVCVRYMRELFTSPETTLEGYTDAQVAQGLYYFVNPSCSNNIFSLFEPEVAWSERRGAILAIGDLFERLFARRCTDHLCHRDQNGSNPLTPVCYIWWEVFPNPGTPGQPEFESTNAELLGVMARTLRLNSVACQESALHGLGHWHLHYPDFVRDVIGQFLTLHSNLGPELRRYAESARQGYVN